MWLSRHRMWQSGHVFTFCSLLLAAGFLLQLKTLYLNHMKNQRMHEYTKMVKEMSQQIERVEKIANSTNHLLGGLQAKLKKYAHSKGTLKNS